MAFTGEHCFIENKPLLLGICGPSCSGKTIISKKLVKIFKDKKPYLFSMDMYYKSLPEGINPEEYNFDCPKAIDFKLLLQNLKNLILWKEFEEPIYDFKTHKRIGFQKVKEIPNLIIIEGIFLLYFKKLREILNYKVYLEAKEEEILKRRIKRDQALRGSSPEFVNKQMEKFVFEGNKKFVDKYKIYSDLILPSNLSIKEKLNLILDFVKIFK